MSERSHPRGLGGGSARLEHRGRSCRTELPFLCLYGDPTLQLLCDTGRAEVTASPLTEGIGRGTERMARRTLALRFAAPAAGRLPGPARSAPRRGHRDPRLARREAPLETGAHSPRPIHAPPMNVTTRPANGRARPRDDTALVEAAEAGDQLAFEWRCAASRACSTPTPLASICRAEIQTTSRRRARVGFPRPCAATAAAAAQASAARGSLRYPTACPRALQTPPSLRGTCETHSGRSARTDHRRTGAPCSLAHRSTILLAGPVANRPGRRAVVRPSGEHDNTL
jgi:hypothetical protein